MGERKLEAALPAFATELETALHRQGRSDLAVQIRSLPLVDRCRCGAGFCATFYTTAEPDSGHGRGQENVIVEVSEGMVVVDLVSDEIRCVEVLNRPDVQELLFAALP